MSRHVPRSMTGFAQAQAEHDGWALRLSIRSVNHRFLDLHMHLPEGFEALEPMLRRIVREHVRRGHLDLSLHFGVSAPGALGVNKKLAAAYMDVVALLRQQFHVQTEPDLVEILRLPGVLAPAALQDEERESFEHWVGACLEETLGRLNQMRETEGRTLAAELRRLLARILELTGRLEALAIRAQPVFLRRLEERLHDLLGDNLPDPARLVQEAALAVDRSDTTEELARLQSHVQQFDAILTGPSESGKKLDFLLQEMQREANTLLSKSPSAEAEGLEMTQLGLDLKAEIEKMREQVQNLE